MTRETQARKRRRAHAKRVRTDRAEIARAYKANGFRTLERFAGHEGVVHGTGLYLSDEESE